MSLMLYNSLSNKLEEFIPGDKNNVKMYVCGPTVYDYIHIGNGRPIVFYDMLRNYLEFIGYKVTYVSNITDIDDKIIAKAIASNVSEAEIAKKYEDAYFEAYDKLGSKRPNLTPHATEYIPQMVDFIDELKKKGYAYQKGTDVFFRIHKILDYGCLSNQVSTELEQGARIDVEVNKENPLDFNLWKDTKIGIKYNSPFGCGRPGWHTECVVMNHRLFGGEIDIHGGGMDLKFPHHENEIAQSQALFGNHLSKYWIHVGRLDFEGAKMSKSLQNTIFVKDLSKHQAKVVRMILLFAPYRNNFNYTEELYNQYEKEYLKWQRAVINANLSLKSMGINSKEINDLDIENFKKCMNQDINVQNVLTLLQEILKTINLATRSGDFSVLSEKVNTFNTILKVFGIDLDLPEIDDEVLTYYKKWKKAREDKQFDVADECRAFLVEKRVM